MSTEMIIIPESKSLAREFNCERRTVAWQCNCIVEEQTSKGACRAIMRLEQGHCCSYSKPILFVVPTYIERTKPLMHTFVQLPV